MINFQNLHLFGNKPYIDNKMRIISIHFPKAAGTSLRKQLKSHFRSSFLYYNNDPLTASGFETVDDLPKGVKAVHGHFRAARYDAVSNAFRFTFLRDPVENLISIYFYWLTLRPFGHPWHDKFVSEKPSILDFGKYGPFRCLMSETYFGNYDMSRLDFIGFYETRARDLPRLGELIGVNLNVEYHTNRTRNTEAQAALKLDESKKDALRTLLAEDVRFYEHQRSVRDAIAKTSAAASSSQST